MQQDVYADLLFLINFSMDYLCLYICARILHRPMRLWRMILGSSIGGLYSIAALFISAHPAVDLLLDAAVCIGMSAIVFSQRGRRFSSTLLSTFLFVGISMMTGGGMTAIFNLLNRLELPLDGIEADGLSTYLFAIVAAAAGFISMRSTSLIARKASVRECILNVSIDDKSITLTAISDTGNLAKDPLSGKRIVLIDRSALSEIIDVSKLDSFARAHTENIDLSRPVRIVPINTAAGRSLLCAVTPDKMTCTVVTKKGKNIEISLDALVAPSDIKSSADGASAVIPADILKI